MNFEITDEIIERAKRVNENYGKILQPLNLFYYHSIVYSAECSLTAFEKYEYFLQKQASPIDLVSSLQEAIGHATNLSWYFFNDGGKRKPKEIIEFIKNRSNGFKEEFNITDESALKDRRLRNMFEHFDEKLDIYLLQTLAGTFYPMPKVGKISEIGKKEFDKNFKMLDIEEKCLVILNEEFYFEEIAKEVFRIYEIAKLKALP